tara:strand:+ start:993 stop:1418 length:426 start_codon:yes stop_codon:yes gene_type:complete
MPKSRVKKKRLFREVSFQHERYVNKNYLKNLRNVKRNFCKEKGVLGGELDFLLWAYDKEFWTKNYASENYDFSIKNIGERMLVPLQKKELVYKHFKRYTPSKTHEDHLFRDETKTNYRVRYGITQKARMLVQSFYNRLEKS